MQTNQGRCKVLVTGIGMISPLGNGKVANWEAVLAGTNAIQKIPGLSSECKIGGSLPKTIFNPDDYPTSLKSPIYSLSAAIMEQTIMDANLQL